MNGKLLTTAHIGYTSGGFQSNLQTPGSLARAVTVDNESAMEPGRCKPSTFGQNFKIRPTLMEITDEIEKNRILSKISKRINIAEYYDIHNLTSDEFSKKYGYWGFSFRNFYEIRFYNDTNVLIQLRKLTTSDNQYYFLPIDKDRRIYKDNIDFIDSLNFENHLNAHLIIADDKLNWFLVKDNFNKLIGIGDYFKKKIKKMIHLKFDNEKLMHVTHDEE